MGKPVGRPLAWWKTCSFSQSPTRYGNRKVTAPWWMYFASSRPGPQPAKRDDAMKTKMVSYTPETLPQLTKADRAKLKALAARPDSEIDTCDIPEMTDEQWNK